MTKVLHATPLASKDSILGVLPLPSLSRTQSGEGSGWDEEGEVYRIGKPLERTQITATNQILLSQPPPQTDST